MKIKEAHSSSAVEYKKAQNIKYVGENEIKTYSDQPKSTTSIKPDGVITWKTTVTSTKVEKNTARFEIDVKKNAIEEATYRLNEKLRGKRQYTVSTTNK